MSRVKFYPGNRTYGYYLKEYEWITQEYDDGKVAKSINDIIEIYNMKKYFDNDVYPIDWTPDNAHFSAQLIKNMVGPVGRFFNTINDENFFEIYLCVENFYKNDYWELIEKFKVYERISDSRVQSVLNESKMLLHSLLKFKRITEHFGLVIRNYMIANSSTAELLIDKFEVGYFEKTKKIYFPKTLSSEDKEMIIEKYVNSSNPNPNYLRLISNIQSNKDRLEISSKIQLKAKRRLVDEEEKIFHEHSGFSWEIIISFSKTQKEEVFYDFDEHSIRITYSSEWITENKDYATLLNNFIYLFEIVDFQMRCRLVNKFNRMSIFERFLTMNSKSAYKKGFEFDQSNIIASLQMAGYYNLLLNVGIRIEEIIEWFFKEYLNSEFNIKSFIVSMPSLNSTYLEKCTNIMPAMESVLKQFSLLIEEGEIDFELLEIRSEQLIYSNIPSMVDKKYVYGVHGEFVSVTELLFSDQSGLAYRENALNSYTNFFEMLCEEEVNINEIPEYNLSSLNWLIEKEYLSLDDDKFLAFTNEQLILILRDLYFNEVISYWKYSTVGRKVIDKLNEREIVEFESSLFSRPEQNYLNYILNKSQFNNGLDLRNKYSHTQPSSNQFEEHKSNYLFFLRIFILTVIKINDDCCTSDYIKKAEE